jgi:hypothetical protein
MNSLPVKRFLAPILLAVALAAAALALRGKGRLPDTPEDAVKSFFAAAQDGDVAAYLGLTAGELRQSLAETQSQLGAAEFRNSIRESVTGLKGFAVSRNGEASGDRVSLDVELTFADRSERQRFDLIRQPRGWSIAAIDRATVDKSVKPYGEPVFDIAPASEGNPEPPDSSSAKPSQE